MNFEGVHHRYSEVKVLLIDDEETFRKALAQQLQTRGFVVLDTGNGEETRSKLSGIRIRKVVILDQKMPGMDGIQTLKEIKKIRPEVQVIMHTGHGSIELARITGKNDVLSFIEKPCPKDHIITAIRAALRGAYARLGQTRDSRDQAIRIKGPTIRCTQF